mgnify:CR=1 FL=1
MSHALYVTVFDFLGVTPVTGEQSARSAMTIHLHRFVALAIVRAVLSPFVADAEAVIFLNSTVFLVLVCSNALTEAHGLLTDSSVHRREALREELFRFV